MKSLLACAVVGAATLGGTPASAEETETYDPDSPLPEIVVTARRIESSPNLARDVGQDDFKAWNAHTAAEALVQTPGVNVQYGGSSGDARAWIRGYRHRDVLVMFDGIPIASAFEGNADLNEISLAPVSNIKVLKGAPSVIYGTNGMGGVIDFIPDVARIQDGIEGAVEGGVNSTQRARANLAKRNEDVTWLLSGAYDHSDGFEVSDDFEHTVNQTSDTRTNSDYKRRNLFGYVTAATETLGQTALFYSISDNERGLPPEAGIEDADFERLDESRRQTIGVSNQFESVPASLKLFYNRYDSELTVYTDNTYTDVDEVVEARDYSYGASGYSNFEIGDSHLLVLAASAIKDTYIGDGAFADFDEASLHTYFVAAEDRFALGRFDFTIGAIASHFTPEEGDAIDVIDPQAIVEYEVSDRLSLHGSVAQRTRFARLRELYDRRRGNPLLDEQSAINSQLGLAYRHADAWISDFTFFHSDVEGLIERPDRDSSYENLPDTTFQGVEIATGGWINERLYGRLGYTWLDAEEQLPTGGERQLRSRAEHSGYGELRLRLPARVEVALNAIYSSGLHDLDGDDNYVDLPNSFVMHVKASVALTEALAAYLSVDNLTDENYLHRLGFPQPGRSVRVGLTFDL